MRAFWKNDRFPFLLSSTIVKELDDGRVEIEGYGNGAVIIPLFVATNVRGAEIQVGLDLLCGEYREEKAKLHKLFMAKRDALVLGATPAKEVLS